MIEAPQGAFLPLYIRKKEGWIAFFPPWVQKDEKSKKTLALPKGLCL